MQNPEALVEVRIKTVIRNRFEDSAVVISREYHQARSKSPNSGAWLKQTKRVVEARIHDSIRNCIEQIAKEINSDLRADVQGFWDSVRQSLKERLHSTMNSLAQTMAAQNRNPPFPLAITNGVSEIKLTCEGIIDREVGDRIQQDHLKELEAGLQKSKAHSPSLVLLEITNNLDSVLTFGLPAPSDWKSKTLAPSETVILRSYETDLLQSLSTLETAVRAGHLIVTVPDDLGDDAKRFLIALKSPLFETLHIKRTVDNEMRALSSKLSTKKGAVFETAYDSYTVLGELGQGGSGFVLRVLNQNQEELALKVLKPEMARQEKLGRFRNEINFSTKNTHRNIVRVVDAGFFLHGDLKCPFFVMPIFTSTLAKLIQKQIPTHRVLPLFSQILDGVEAAHKLGTWHRDLKPENILFDSREERLVIADFGIAHFEEEFLLDAVETNHKERLANFIYAAPEQKRRGPAVDRLADIFALGLILNEMFTGTVPQGTQFNKIGDVAPDFAYIDDLVDRMICQSPDKRINSIEKIKEELVARGNHFIAFQKVSDLENSVVPESNLDDPLVLDPVRVVSLDYDDSNERLIGRLNHEVTRAWVDAFSRAPASFTGTHHAGMVEFLRANAVILVPEHQAQEVAKYMKDWIASAGPVYTRLATEEKSRADERRRNDLAYNLERERKRADLLKRLNS